MSEELIALKNSIEFDYGIVIDNIELYRDVVGSLYLIDALDDRYAFKLYKKDTSINVEDVLDIMDFLYNNDLNLPKIIKTKQENLYIKTKDGIGVLFEYIDGEEVNVGLHDDIVFSQHKKIIQVIKSYNGNIPMRGREFYIDRYLAFLNKINYNEKKIIEIRRYTYILYEAISKIEKGFSHGDFHTGNMIYRDGKIYILDFDACNKLSSYVDLMVYYDKTNFNQYRFSDVLETLKTLKSIDLLKDINHKDLMAFIPIRHCEIIATIIESQGYDDINESFYDQQHNWIKSFYEDWVKL